MRLHRLYGLVVLHLTLQSTFALLNEQHVEIDLSDYGRNTTFTYKLYLAEGNVVVNVANATNGRFFVIQAHSFQSNNITLSKTETPTLGSYVVGTNIGMVETPLNSDEVYRYYINYVDKANIQVLLSVILYGDEARSIASCVLCFLNWKSSA